jgi:hypothetical protein
MPWPRDDPDRYFLERGFALRIVEDAAHGDFSADLLSGKRKRRLIKARYGSGSSREEAAQRAMHRYHVEQEPQPTLPRRLL